MENGLIVIVGIMVYEFCWAVHRKMERKNVFREAHERTRESGKKLLVIGNPDGGAMNTMSGRDYGCGDVCTDLTGCPSCPVSIKGDIREVVKEMGSGEWVVFCSCTLEYIDGDITELVQDLVRISGGDLFIVGVGKWSIIGYLYYGRILTGESGARRVMLEYPPSGNKIKWIDI